MAGRPLNTTTRRPRNKLLQPIIFWLLRASATNSKADTVEDPGRKQHSQHNEDHRHSLSSSFFPTYFKPSGSPFSESRPCPCAVRLINTKQPESGSYTMIDLNLVLDRHAEAPHVATTRALNLGSHLLRRTLSPQHQNPKSPWTDLAGLWTLEQRGTRRHRSRFTDGLG